MKKQPHLSVKITRLTPAEYIRPAKLKINYSFAPSPFGKVIIASTAKGICYMGFADNEKQSVKNLQKGFPNAAFSKQSDALQRTALSVFSRGQKRPIKLHLKGSEFQMKVWTALLKIPSGKLSSYGAIARVIKHPKASRAVGSAVGSNPVSVIIPCHRVIQASGALGNYHWGPSRKKSIIASETV